MAVTALELGPGGVAADLGFGGGLGLELLLERVGTKGRVLGVDISPTMVSAESAGLACKDHLRSGQGDAAAHVLVFARSSQDRTR